MDWLQIQRLKVRLEIREHELRRSIQYHLQHARSVGSEPDLLEESSNRHEAESLLKKISNEQELLQMVAAALGRIRDESFGRCLSCGNEIDGRRLEAVPWTRYCIHCQENAER